MAALPYIQLYIADYLADTMHLTAEEHGAYLLLMFNYWQTGKPIQKSRLQKIARVPNERWASVEVSLNEFFNDAGSEWVHTRIDRDLESVKASQDQRSAAGKASAASRAKKKKPGVDPKQVNENEGNSNGSSTVVDFSLNENPTNKDTDTDTDTDKELSTSNEVLVPDESEDGNHASCAAKIEKPSTKIPPCPHEEIIAAYHEVLPELMRVREWNDTRRKLLKARWREKKSMQSVDAWRRYFGFVQKCDFLMGRSEQNGDRRPFEADLEWLIRPTNFTKVIEGKYQNRGGGR